MVDGVGSGLGIRLVVLFWGLLLCMEGGVRKKRCMVNEFVRMYFVILYCLMGILHEKKATSTS
jgi:hypothetical protein